MTVRREKSVPGASCDTPALVKRTGIIAGVEGQGQWLIFEFVPASLFSLKTSRATSTVGRTLLTPTPYSIKMAILDAGFRCEMVRSNEQADDIVRALAQLELRIGVPNRAVVTHTIVKVRQEVRPDPKKPPPDSPYISSVGYREFVHMDGSLQIAMNLTTSGLQLTTALLRIMPTITYFGKRSSFMQFRSVIRAEALSLRFTTPLEELQEVPKGVHIATLDDFGTEANFAALNSFSKVPIKRGKHRRFVETVVPLGLTRTGPGFSEYQADLSI